MPKLKNYGPGRRRMIWVKERHMKLYDSIENKSAFMDICLDIAIDIMAWDILKKMDPEKYHLEHEQSLEEILFAFNKKHPLDPLTAKRLEKDKNAPTIREILSESS